MLHFGTKATYELKTSFLYSQVDLEFVANGTRATRMSYVRTYEGAISQNAYKTGGGGRRGGSPPRHAITSSYVRGTFCKKSKCVQKGDKHIEFPHTKDTNRKF